MQLEYQASSEDLPGPKWAAHFSRYWPAYHAWWLKEGVASRPTYAECRRAIRTHMPEIANLYDNLCELAGGGDAQARFLSFWTPPAYLAGCSQAIWPGEEPLLVRNYDYNPNAFDALILATGWDGRRVIGMSDGMWGLLDGINDAGLALSLTFGGRRVTGMGFGVPLILRYVLQTCETAEEAGAALSRIPTHMSYNVTVIDAERRYLTAMMAPDRETVITHAAVATNHQDRVEWSAHARMTATVEREQYLLRRLTLHIEPPAKFLAAFLRPPLYSTAFAAGFGTLYTASYKPHDRQMSLHWPRSSWDLDLNHPQDGARTIVLPV